jgi:hypothetical protein
LIVAAIQPRQVKDNAITEPLEQENPTPKPRDYEKR